MSPFTEEDLKRLKELDSAASIHDHYGNEEIRKVIPALLARLEAVEELSDAQRSLAACSQDDFDTSDGDGYVFQELVKEKEEAWRKAAGK